MGVLTAIKAFFAAGKAASLAEKAAIIATVFFVGFAWGQHSVTSKAVTAAIETVQTHADVQYAKDTGVIAAQVKEGNKNVAVDADTSRKAADAATALLINERLAAQHDHDSLSALLASERAARLKLEASHVVPPTCPTPEPFSWSGAVRVMLDKAAGATGPAPVDVRDPDPATTTARGAAGGASAATAAAATARSGP